MRNLLGGAALLMASSVAYAANTCPCPPPFVASETLEHPSGRCLDNGLILTAANGVFAPGTLPPFKVSMNEGTLVGIFTVTADAALRYTTSDGGQCAGAVIAPIDSHETVIIGGVEVNLSKKAFVCTTPDPKKDIVCFQVRGRSPLEVPASCNASRVTDICIDATVL